MSAEPTSVPVPGPPPWAEGLSLRAALGRATAEQIGREVERMVLHPLYPCLGARSVFTRHRASVRVLDELGTPAAAEELLSHLREFAASTDLDDGFASLVAVFRGPSRLTEEEFERLLWQQLRQLRDLDPDPWDTRVSDDPTDPHFSFSAAGTAYFVVGLHPGASRTARRSALPTLVFNPHEQFERLRRSGQFERMQRLIRRRDAELQGAPNPMVSDFGTASEARQYAGRLVPEDWSPPTSLARLPDGAPSHRPRPRPTSSEE